MRAVWLKATKMGQFATSAFEIFHSNTTENGTRSRANTAHALQTVIAPSWDKMLHFRDKMLHFWDKMLHPRDKMLQVLKTWKNLNALFVPNPCHVERHWKGTSKFVKGVEIHSHVTCVAWCLEIALQKVAI